MRGRERKCNGIRDQRAKKDEHKEEKETEKETEEKRRQRW